MTTKGRAPRQEGTKRYLVKCDGCSFERTVNGRDEATQVGNRHRRETGHELVAVEVPPSVASG